jgi:hypothetical protein
MRIYLNLWLGHPGGQEDPDTEERLTFTHT